MMAKQLADLARRPGPARAREPQNAARAYEEGFYKDLVVEYQGLEEDNNMRARHEPRAAREAQARVRPRRRRHDDGGQQHAAHRRRVGGAACSEDWARARGLPVQAYLAYGKVAAVDFVSARKAC